MNEKGSFEEDYQEISNASKDKFTSKKELNFIKRSVDPVEKSKDDPFIQNLENLNPDEINKKRQDIIEFFSYFDTDNTGIINVSDLRNVLELLGINDKSHVNTLITMAEIEGNGYINYRDFAYYIIK